MKIQVLSATAVSAILLAALTACNVAKPPAAISKDKYTEITAEEHQQLPSGLKLLTLDEAQTIAVQNNPSFKARYFAVSQARAQYYSRFASYMPTVTASYDMKSYHNHGYTEDAGASYKTYTSAPSMTASLLVFDSFQREMNLLAARYNWKSSEQLEQDARRLLLQNVAYAFNNVMLAKARREIALEDMRYNRQLLKETELKYGVGASTLSDVLNFKVNYNNAESNLYSANYNLASSKYALAALMGLTEGTIPDDVEFPEELSVDGEMLADESVYLDAALSNRPDLKALRETLEASKFSYYSSIAAFGPVVTANLGVGYNNAASHYSPFASDSGYKSHQGIRRNRYSTFSSGISVSWELFSGGRTFFNMRASQAAMEQAEYTLADKWITVINDVRTAYENYIVSLKTVKLYQKNLEAVRKMRDLVDDEYEAGNCAITRVNEVQREFVNAETSLAQAVVSMHNAKAQILAATNAN
ncbi:MAG: TolC family protein [Lentisphaeria bacterium]|nr:TolC family protein [Lentisphaeria bacterium]